MDPRVHLLEITAIMRWKFLLIFSTRTTHLIGRGRVIVYATVSPPVLIGGGDKMDCQYDIE